MNPFSVLAFALHRAWEEYISVLLISVFWLAAQILIIPGPPATAVLFAMARQTHDRQFWNAGDVWAALKALFWPAWKWAMPNIVVVGLALYNLSTFWNVPGGLWVILRVIWFMGLVVWLGMNFFYWPFFHAAEDRSWANTYKNSARFWLLHPLLAAVLFLICLIVGLISLPFALPIILGVVFIIALISETAVRRSLERAY
ncbi:MAG: hypothetical protein R6X18_16080 [Chloroflexota bacterium]|jgi:hypothetical protein